MKVVIKKNPGIGIYIIKTPTPYPLISLPLVELYKTSGDPYLLVKLR